MAAVLLRDRTAELDAWLERRRAPPGEHRLQCSLNARTSPEVAFTGTSDLAFECEAGKGRLTARSESRSHAPVYIQLRPLG